MPQLTTRPEQYSAESMRARVVDAETGDGIPDAVVLVLWRTIDTYRLTFASVYTHYEVVTDGGGKFEIPRWGPRTLHYDYYLDARDPEIWILKRGYLLGYFDNTGAIDPRVFRAIPGPTSISKPPPARVLEGKRQRYARDANAASLWHDKTLTLKRAASPQDEARSLAVATPLGPHELSRTELTRFWQEWTAARDGLPEMLRKELGEPSLPRSRPNARSDSRR